MRTKAFTLIELLIVIGILAILATAVLLVINPVQLVKQSRDGNRMTEITQIDQALLLYQSFGGSSSSMGSHNVVYISLPSNEQDCGDLDLPDLVGGYVYACKPSSTYRNIDGTGWIPVDFTRIQSQVGALFSYLPIDLVNSSESNLYYTYINGSWALSATLESERYLSTNAINDGGRSDTRFEVGNNLAMNANLPEEVSGGGGEEAVVPGAPTDLNAEAGNARATISFSAPSSDGGSSITSYTVTSNPGDIVATGSASPITVTGLTNGTTYTFTVRATNVAGTGTASVASNTSTPLSFTTPYTWVSNMYSNTVSQLNSPSGTAVGAYSVGSYPYGLAVDSANNVWIANYGSSSVTKLNSSGETIGTYNISGSGMPTGIAIDASGNVWVTDQMYNKIFKLNSSGETIGIYNVNTAYGIAIDPSNNIWIANAGSNQVTKLNSTGTVIGTYSVGSYPMHLAIDTSGNVWVSNKDSATVSKLNSSGALIGTYNVDANPYGIVIDASGNVWVVCRHTSNVFKFDPSGSILGTYYGGGSHPEGIAIDASGYIWVAAVDSNSIVKLNSAGTVIAAYNVGDRPYSFGDMTGFTLQYFVLGRR